MNDSPDVNTKTALLLAAMEVFADKGFDSATVRDICGLAKANVAAVNYHYGSKDGLYASVLEEIFPKGEEWSSEDNRGLPVEERLRKFVKGLAEEIYLQSTGQIAQKWAIFLREMAKPSQESRHHRPAPGPAARQRAARHPFRTPRTGQTPDRTLAYCSSNIWAMMLDHLLTRPILDRLTPHRPSLEVNVDDFVDHMVSFSLGGIMAVKK